MLGDYSRPTNAVKRRVLRNQEHYYIFAVGTECEHQGRGELASFPDGADGRPGQGVGGRSADDGVARRAAGLAGGDD